MHTTKIYCCRCEDIYYPRSSRQANVDGAYFGTTFCHLFLQSYAELQPQPPASVYVPRIFGFKIHRPQGAPAASAGRAVAAAAAAASSSSSRAAGGSGSSCVCDAADAAPGASSSQRSTARVERASHEGGDEGDNERTPGGGKSRGGGFGRIDERADEAG